MKTRPYHIPIYQSKYPYLVMSKPREELFPKDYIIMSYIKFNIIVVAWTPINKLRILRAMLEFEIDYAYFHRKHALE